VDALERLTDKERACLQVDVLPAQAQHLAPAHPIEDQHHERRIAEPVNLNEAPVQGVY
jgi:hypothetical protein